MSALEGKVVDFWNDGSLDAIELAEGFRESGYEVRTIFSESPNPVVAKGGDFYHGYHEIRWVLVVWHQCHSDDPSFADVRTATLGTRRHQDFDSAVVTRPRDP